MALDAPAEDIKTLATEIEESHPLGRLFDMDVIAVDGRKADRSELGLGPRPCLICGGPARECARSRTHTVAELQTETDRRLREGVCAADAKDAARLACQALLYEVGTTPKPGLVDRENSGSHRDMDIFTFFSSSSALWPYFETCARIGRETADNPAPETFRRIRPAGRQAEADMLAATGGVNTHKGAIFSLGILCAAMGRLPRSFWRSSDRLLKECAAMAHGLVEQDFGGLTEENACTVGQKLYLRHGITGIRGQVEAGFPAVSQAGLPTLKKGLSAGLSLNDAGCAALLALMTAATDTNLIARSSLETQKQTVSRIRGLLEGQPFPDGETLRRLDREFTEDHLSPGGSADLLAICYLLYFLEREE